MLQISMPIIMPITSGETGSWTESDTKVWIAIYLAITILWVVNILYSVIFNKVTLKQALSTDNDYYIFMSLCNIFYYIIALIAVCAVIGVAIYNVL